MVTVVSLIMFAYSRPSYGPVVTIGTWRQTFCGLQGVGLGKFTASCYRNQQNSALGEALLG